jgi:hypothetical protein
MYKLQVNSGLGDCLNLINRTKIVDRCLSEGTKCFINYRTDKEALWTLRNGNTFETFIKTSELFEYVDDGEVFSKLNIENAAAKSHSKEYMATKKLVPIPVPLCGAVLDTEKTNIAMQVSGAIGYKRFSDKQLYEIFSTANPTKVTFNLVDHPNNFKKNKDKFAAFPHVVCREFDFCQNYHLITICDLLIGPDSFGKYAANAAGKKIVIVCTKAPYIKDINEMFKWFFYGIFENPHTKILGWKNTEELVDNISDFPVGSIIAAIKEFMPDIWK